MYMYDRFFTRESGKKMIVNAKVSTLVDIAILQRLVCFGDWCVVQGTHSTLHGSLTLALSSLLLLSFEEFSFVYRFSSCCKLLQACVCCTYIVYVAQMHTHTLTHLH